MLSWSFLGYTHFQFIVNFGWTSFHSLFDAILIFTCVGLIFEIHFCQNLIEIIFSNDLRIVELWLWFNRLILLMNFWLHWVYWPHITMWTLTNTFFYFYLQWLFLCADRSKRAMGYYLFKSCFVVYNNWLFTLINIFRILRFKRVNGFLIDRYLYNIPFFRNFWYKFHIHILSINNLRSYYIFSEVSIIKTSTRVFTTTGINELIFSSRMIILWSKICVSRFQLEPLVDSVLI